MAYDALVLGLGGMGAAALAHLARRGARVIGVEQDDVPSERGSSVGETRVIRKAYYEDPRYVPLLERAYVLWRELEEGQAEELFVRTGCLNLGPADHEAIAGVLASAAQHGLAHERLDEREVRARFPALAPAPGDVGVFEEDAGFLRVEACTRAHVRAALERGAEVRTRARVVAVSAAGGEVRAVLDDGTRLVAGRLVLAAGPWLAAAPALRALVGDLPLVVTRQVQLWFRPRAPELARPPAMPAFIHFLGGGRAFYGLPFDCAAAAREPGLKVCRHHGGEPTTPEGIDRTLRPADEETVRGYLRAHLTSGDGPLLRARVCMYTCTPDLHFVVGRVSDAPPVVVLGGFSGHGYKMASVIGEIAAGLALDGATPFDLSMFAPSRFAGAMGRP